MFTIAAIALSLVTLSDASPLIYLVAPPTNDLARLLLSTPQICKECKFVADAETAVTLAKHGDRVFLLANNNYPIIRTHIPSNFYQAAETTGFHGYVEFPENNEFPTRALSWKQRVVVTTSKLTTNLPFLRILQLQDPSMVDYCQGQKCGSTNTTTTCEQACNTSLLSFAQIAGVDTAAYGLQQSEQVPLLFLSGSVHVAATPLSLFKTGRAAPQEAWRLLWTALLGFEVPTWEADVRPTYSSSSHPLPSTAVQDAVLRSSSWISTGSTLLTISNRGPQNATSGCCQQLGGNQECTLEQCTWKQICPAPYLPKDGTVKNVSCIQEGFSSIIHTNGSQHLMPLFIRTDGNAEAAMALASAAVLVSSSSQNSKNSQNNHSRWMVEAAR